MLNEKINLSKVYCCNIIDIGFNDISEVLCRTVGKCLLGFRDTIFKDQAIIDFSDHCMI